MVYNYKIAKKKKKKMERYNPLPTPANVTVLSTQLVFQFISIYFKALD